MTVLAKNVRLLIDEFDFSGDSNSLTLALSADVIEAPAFQAASVERMPGLPKSKLQHNGYYTGPAAGNLERELDARLGTANLVHVGVLFDTRAVGNPAYVLPGAWEDQLDIEAPIAELLTLAGSWAELPAKRGYTLLDGEVVATGAGTVVTLPAAGSAGGKAYLFVRGISGAAVNATITVQCAAAVGFSSPTTLGTFTFSGVGVVGLTLPSTVQQYVRINVTGMGGASSITAAAVICVNDVTG